MKRIYYTYAKRVLLMLPKLLYGNVLKYKDVSVKNLKIICVNQLNKKSNP